MGTDSHGYGLRPDRTKEDNFTTYFEINDQVVYDHDLERGILRISASPASLENLKRAIGEIPKEGKDLDIPDFLGIGITTRFRAVKAIESIPGLKEDEYLLSF